MNIEISTGWKHGKENPIVFRPYFSDAGIIGEQEKFWFGLFCKARKFPI